MAFSWIGAIGVAFDRSYDTQDARRLCDTIWQNIDVGRLSVKFVPQTPERGGPLGVHSKFWRGGVLQIIISCLQ